MTIKTELKTLEKNKVELTVAVTADKFKEAIGQAYRSISAKAKIPGFRAGKVPARIIDTYYGKGYVLQQALEDGLPNFYSQAVHDSGIRPITRPDIEILSAEENKELKFKAQVEVEPEVKLPGYKDLKVELKKEKVKSEDVEAQLDTIKNRFAEIKPAAGKVAEEGDFVLINFDGEVDGKIFEGGSAENYLLELGSMTFFEGFEKQLVGSKAGDIKSISVNMPPNIPNAEIAGKVAIFKVLIKEVKVKELPELTDKFVKEITGFEKVEALKSEIKNDLQKALDRKAQNEYRLAALRQLAEKSEAAIPPSLTEQTLGEMLQEFEAALKNQGITKEHYLKTNNVTEEELRKKWQKPAEERTREQLALKALIEQEKIDVTDEEINKAIEEFSKNEEKPLSRKELEEKGLIGYLKSNIIYNKTLDLLVEKIEKEKQK